MSIAKHDYNEEVALSRCLPREEILDFDKCLKQCSLFTGITDSDNTIEIPQKTKIYNALVLVFLYSNVLRTTIECFLPKGSQWFLYLGDFKPWWGEPYIAHQVVFYMAVLVVPTICTLNITAEEPLRRWCLPFRYMQGLISAKEAKIYNIGIAKKLKKKMRFGYRKAFFATFSVNIPYSISVFVSFFIFCTDWSQLLLIGIPWTVYESLWSFFICSNMGLLPSAFEVVCYYLRLRYEQIDKMIDQLNYDYEKYSSNRLSLLDRRHKLNRLLWLLNDANKDVMDYDKYWSKYTAIVFMSYIPQLLFELFIFLFLPMNTSVLLFSLLLNCNIFALISQMAMFSALLHQKANRIYHKLNSTYVRMNRTSVDVNKWQFWQMYATKRNIKMAMFIERYSSKIAIGINVLDIRLMDLEFYYHLVIEGILYFLLIVSLLRTSQQ